MTRALALARRGLYSTDPNPRVGCVIAHGERVVGEGWHRYAGEPHAEVHALAAAGGHAAGATAYVTLEPCLMCAGAMLQARSPRLVFSTWDPKAGACGSLFTIHQDARLNHQIAVTYGILENESRDLLQRFFQQLRQDQPLTMN